MALSTLTERAQNLERELSSAIGRLAGHNDRLSAVAELAERNEDQVAALRNMAEKMPGFEAQIEQTFGFAVAVLLRDGADLQRIVDDNPFTNDRREDSVRLYVTFLARQPSAARLAALAVPAGSADEFVVAGEEIYLFCPKGYGTSKLSNTFFEKKLDVPATTRNWNTVNALHRLASGR